MPDLSAPFIIEASVRLPGLGLLVLPAAPAPGWLATYELHTALAISLPVSALSPQSVIGTIEEIARNGQLTERALLLAFDPDNSLAVGTRLQVSEASLDLM
jgi:hypothetical protein